MGSASRVAHLDNTLQKCVKHWTKFWILQNFFGCQMSHILRLKTPPKRVEILASPRLNKLKLKLKETLLEGVAKC